MEQARPVVFVLGDGSGYTGRRHLDSTARSLEAARARRGDVFGRCTDGEVYAALLEGRTGLFLNLAEELADAFVREGVTRAIGDAAEGHNPVNDVCRALTAAAAALARARGDLPLAEHEFGVVGAPDTCPKRLRRWALWVRLDDAALGRKLAAARAYTELKAEVDRDLRTWGEEAFRTECLRPAVSWTAPAGVPPAYERRGEEHAAAGDYRKVIRGYAHVAPVVVALRRHAARHTPFQALAS
jgi:hypothetical protein